MRPLKRGDWPIDAAGNQVNFATYGNSKPYLLERLDEYCSYCERPLKNAEAEVEHMLPKSTYPGSVSDWNNFLLACKSCNSRKLNRDTNPLADFLWPDRDDTFVSFEYREDGTLAVAAGLSPAETKRAMATLSLLDAGFSAPAASFGDDRCQQRLEAVFKVKLTVQTYADMSPVKRPLLHPLIVELARSTGFWSLWMVHFKDNAAVRQLLIDNWVGTDETRL